MAKQSKSRADGERQTSETPVSTEQKNDFRNPYEPDFEDAADHDRFLKMAANWRAEFSKLETPDQQRMIFGLMHDRLYWRIISYMRRFPERVTSGRQTYSDRCVGVEELRVYMGAPDENGFTQNWLEDNRVPPLENAQNMLQLLNAQIAEILDCGGDSAIARIRANFDLSDIELEILSTLVIAMREETLLRMMAVAWADFAVRIPTVSFLSGLLSESPQQAEFIAKLFSEQAKLRRYRLIIAERHALYPNYTPRAYAPISIEQTVIDAFSGERQAGDLPPNMFLHTKPIPKRQLICAPATLEEIKYAMAQPAARICLIGPKHAGRRTILASAAQQLLKKNVLEVDVCREFERVPPEDVESRFSCLMREALFEGSILLLRCDAIDDKQELLHKLNDHAPQISRLVSGYPGCMAVLAEKYNAFFDDLFGHLACIHIQPPDASQAEDVWKRALAPWTSPEECSHMAEIFARNYSLPIGSIFGVVRDAVESQQNTTGDTQLQSHHILNEIRKSFRHQLGTLAEITVSDVPLAGVVLTDDAKAQVDEILEYAKNLHNVLDIWGFRQRSPYGNALSVLFAGPPGTGKTLLACALANELGKVLYRVDLSRIVDKYIGETEKNLGKIFDEAAKAQAIILFDEADSLFAKRTEVKSSNDRYANLEINYLLQKLESYNGITILTTNLSKSIDEAFRRRLRYIVDFPMPDVPARVALWKRMLPPNAPVDDDIRWTWLAKTFEMSGGYIRNAVLKASIAASAAGKPISMDFLAKAAADQARSMGKLMRVSDDYDDYDDDDDDDGPRGRWD